MSEPIDTLSKVTGLTKTAMDEIFQKVKANQAKLNACQRHDFSIPLDRHTKQPISERKAFCDWECRNCHGWVDGIAKGWYERGVAHAQHELMTKGA